MVTTDPRYVQAFTRLQEIRAEIGARELELHEMLLKHAERAGTFDRRRARAQAIADGVALEEVALPNSKDIEDIRARLVDLRAAERIQDVRVSELRASLSREHFPADRNRDHLSRIAEAALVLGEAVDAWETFRSELVEGGFELGSISEGGGIALANWSAKDPSSVLNARINEMEALGGRVPARTALAHALREREAATVRSMERQKEQGHLLSASPKGIREWFRGKLIRDEPAPNGNARTRVRFGWVNS